jgi:hypothetical protein
MDIPRPTIVHQLIILDFFKIPDKCENKNSGHLPVFRVETENFPKSA